MKPLQTRLATSTTVTFFFALCALFEILWLAQLMSFIKVLFHGLDFRLLQSTEASRWQELFYALVVLALWGFAIGAFFPWLHNVINRRSS